MPRLPAGACERQQAQGADGGGRGCEDQSHRSSRCHARSSSSRHGERSPVCSSARSRRASTTGRATSSSARGPTSTLIATALEIGGRRESCRRTGQYVGDRDACSASPPRAPPPPPTRPPTPPAARVADQAHEADSYPRGRTWSARWASPMTPSLLPPRTAITVRRKVASTVEARGDPATMRSGDALTHGAHALEVPRGARPWRRVAVRRRHHFDRLELILDAKRRRCAEKPLVARRRRTRGRRRKQSSPNPAPLASSPGRRLARAAPRRDDRLE